MRNPIIAALAIIVAGLLPTMGRAGEVYVYDSLNNVVETLDPQGSVTAMAYDSADGQMAIATVDSGHTTITRYQYDSVHNVVSQVGSTVTEPDIVTSMTYDPDGDRIITSTGTGEGADYTSTNHTSYDTANQGLVTSMTYDGLDRIVEAETDSSGRTTIYQYDHDMHAHLDSSGSISTGGMVTSMTYAYDSASRLVTAIDDMMGDHTITQYDDAGAVVGSPIDALGRVTSMTYDADGNRVIAAEDGAGGNSTIYRYQYDSSGNLGPGSQLFDALGRVTSTAYDSGDQLLFLAVVPLPQSFSMGAALLALMMGARFLARFRHGTVA